MEKLNLNDELIVLKDNNWLKNQQIAGKCVSEIFDACVNLISDFTPNLSLKNLESVALGCFEKHNCIPTFKDYKGFPSAICTSVNKQLVHGIVTDYILKNGDLITVDVGATCNGAIADAARTWIYGQPKDKRHAQLLQAGQEALKAGISAVQIGKQIGSIGNSIYKNVKNSSLGYWGIIVDYGGHGLEKNKPHADPFISNKDSASNGIRIVPGLSIAIEPMLTINISPKTHVLEDKWTVLSDSICCHFEDSITVMEDGIYNITGSI